MASDYLDSGKVPGVPSVYQRIMRAAEEGSGVRFTYREVLALSMDSAIEAVAINDDQIDEDAKEKP